jgi:predicted HicB family RNase H-like nuclease
MTTNILEYKDFIGSVNYTDEDECFYGKMEGINDLITFEGASVKELKKGFKDAVEDYLELCKELNTEPYKSVKGSFNIRIEPKLHYSAIYTALKKGISLNQFVAEAIKNNVDKKLLNHS